MPLRLDCSATITRQGRPGTASAWKLINIGNTVFSENAEDQATVLATVEMPINRIYSYLSNG
jgi:hypothetical protein